MILILWWASVSLSHSLLFIKESMNLRFANLKNVFNNFKNLCGLCVQNSKVEFKIIKFAEQSNSLKFKLWLKNFWEIPNSRYPINSFLQAVLPILHSSNIGENTKIKFRPIQASAILWTIAEPIRQWSFLPEKIFLFRLF